MATSEFHKAQAEGLIKQANYLKEKQPVYWRDRYHDAVALAQVHATLATIQEYEE